MTIEQPSLLASAALDDRSRRALALVRALRGVAINLGHAQHAAACDWWRAVKLGDDLDMQAAKDERYWRDASARGYRLLLAELGISDTADESDDAEDAFQQALDGILGADEVSEGKRV